MKRSRIVGKLIYNALRYRVLKFTGWPAHLESLSLEITHRCICRCVMCNIWKIPNDVPDLPLSDWTGLLTSPECRTLRELDITGGEPFLREDLASFLTWVARAKSAYFPQLKTVAITTNGILTDKILNVTNEVVDLLAEQGIDLVLVCGLDSVDELHDKIRNLKNAWQKLSTTITALESLREKHSNLVLGVKTTIIPANVCKLDKISSFAEEHGLFTIVSPRIITANRFGNQDLKDDLSFSDEDYQLMRQFYEGPAFAWSGHRQAMLNYLTTGEVDKPCSAGFNTLFVRHTGEVFPCPLIPISLGNLKQERLADMLSSTQAAQFRRNIKTYPECKTCTEPGLERISWTFEGLTCLRQLIAMGFKDFERLAQHMGLNKYF